MSNLIFILVILILNPVQAQTSSAEIINFAMDEAVHIDNRRYINFNSDTFCPDLISLEEHNQLNARIDSAHKLLNTVDESTLDNSTLINFLMVKENFIILSKTYKYNEHLNIINHQWGPHFAYIYAWSQFFGEKTQDFEKLISCIQNYPAYNEIFLSYLNILKPNILASKNTLQVFAESLRENTITNIQTSYLFKPFLSMPDSISIQDKQRLISAAINAITNFYIPAYDKFKDFFNNDYLPFANNATSASEIAGEDYYKFLVYWMTDFPNINVEEIHKLGLSEVKRIHAQMEEIMEQVNFKGSLKEFFDYLRNDPKFFATSSKELLREISYIMKIVDGKINILFNNLPRSPYSVKEMPSEMANTAATGYYSPSMKVDPMGLSTGYFVVNTSNLKAVPLYILPALTLHEAVPGHHLQVSISKELKGLHEFRKRTTSVSYSEGWGLYAESLGEDLGLYNDPYKKFGQLEYELWRSLRLVVDTGLHAKNWSKEKAIKYMLENSSQTEYYITNEVNRYIAWPGQALAYKIGQLFISQLKNELKNKLGDKFNIREFHDQVLGNGALPLPVLKKVVFNYYGLSSSNNSLIH